MFFFCLFVLSQMIGGIPMYCPRCSTNSLCAGVQDHPMRYRPKLKFDTCSNVIGSASPAGPNTTILAHFITPWVLPVRE